MFLSNLMKDIEFILNQNKKYMKKIFIVLNVSFFTLFFSQTVDTIEISQFKSTQILFKDDVTHVEPGTGDLQVKTKLLDNNVLIIQSIVPKNDFIVTNLFVKTKNSVYNPILKFVENSKKTTFLESNLKSSINQISVQNQTDNNLKSVDKKTERKEDMILLQRIINSSEEFKPSREYQTGVWFKFYAHYVNQGKFYLKFQLDNESELDYYFDNFFFSIRNKKKRNASETQKELNYNRIIDTFEKVSAKDKRFLIFEFNSFSLNRDEEFIIELQEKKGSRNFKIGIPYYIINQPIKL